MAQNKKKKQRLNERNGLNGDSMLWAATEGSNWKVAAFIPGSCKGERQTEHAHWHLHHSHQVAAWMPFNWTLLKAWGLTEGKWYWSTNRSGQRQGAFPVYYMHSPICGKAGVKFFCAEMFRTRMWLLGTSTKPIHQKPERSSLPRPCLLHRKSQKFWSGFSKVRKVIGGLWQNLWGYCKVCEVMMKLTRKLQGMLRRSTSQASL